MTPVEYKNRLAKVYQKVGSRLLLKKPIRPDELERQKSLLNFEIDRNLCEFWKAYNGGETYSPFFARRDYFTGYDFNSFEQSLAQRESMKKRADQYEGYIEPEPRDSRILSGWFQNGWLPFGSFGGSSLLIISDTSPSASGRAGQVIGYIHDPDEIVYIAESFDSFLQLSIQALENDYEEYLEGTE